MNVLAKLLGIGFFISPFLIAYGIYLILNPVGFYQTCIWFVLAFLVCFFEGIFAWIVGFILISD